MENLDFESIKSSISNSDNYEDCWNTGNYDDQDCNFCPHKDECSGFEG